MRRAFERVRREQGLPLELRLGFELTPSRALLDEDLRRYELEGTGAVLMEVPFSGPADILVRLAEHAEGFGLRPVIAHPERTQAVQDRPALADELAERGWLLQVNATSLTGDHGPDADELGWRLVRERDGIARRVGRAPADPAAAPRRGLRGGDPEGGGGAGSVAVLRGSARLQRANSISRRQASRLSDSTSICRTRSRVMPRTRPISSSVFGSSSASP